MKKLLYSGMIALMTFFAVGSANAEDVVFKNKVKVKVQPEQWFLDTEAPEVGVAFYGEENGKVVDSTGVNLDSCSIVMTLKKGDDSFSQTIASTQVTLDVEKLTVGDWAITYKLVDPKDNTKEFTGAEVDADSCTTLLTVKQASETDMVKVTLKPAKWIMGSENPVVYAVDIYREGGDPTTGFGDYSIMMTLKKGNDSLVQKIDATSGEVNSEKLTLGDWAISYKLVDPQDSTKAFEGKAEIDVEGSTEVLVVAEASDMVQILVKPEKWEMGTDAPMYAVSISREGGDAQTGFDDYSIMMTLTKGTESFSQKITSTQGDVDAAKLSVGEWTISYKLVDPEDSTKVVTIAEIDPTSTFELTVVEKGAANEGAEFAGVNVYPNPSNGEFNVVVPVRAEVEIFAANGAMVKRFAVAEGTTQVRLNNSGVYFVRFTAENGQVAVKRVVVR